jgi:hypothetical protein
MAPPPFAIALPMVFSTAFHADSQSSGVLNYSRLEPVFLLFTVRRGFEASLRFE